MSSNLSNVEILNNLLEGRDLDELTSRSLMQRWLDDEISDVETGAFLSALRAKSSTGVELSSMAEELLNVCKLPVERPNLYLVDTCGTGGDGANTFNISTAVAFVAASCGVKIAKHVNRRASGKVCSADGLWNLGLDLNCSLEKVITAVSEIGIKNDIEKILNFWKISKNELFLKTKNIWSNSFRPSNTNKDLVGSGFDASN